jgi:hypothetical protein
MFTRVVLMSICAALVGLGVVLVVRWGDADDGDAARRPARSPVVRLARYGAAMAAAGLAAGLLAAGAGGRLAMRVLALTSSDVRGSFTEGGAQIGEITLEGTLSFITFIGVTSGLLSGVLYAFLRPLLPRGYAGGVALGAILLVLAGSRIDPLRADNIDFALVGPDWLSVLLFTALALFQGMLVVALAGRLSPWVPRAPRAVMAGRVAAAVVVLAALPGFVGAVGDILAAY